MEVNRLCLTEEDRITLEHDTRERSGDDRWHDAQRKRITGSKCGRILEQKNRTVALLRFCLYPKLFLFLPKAIEWGHQNDPVACKRYVQYMNSHGHPGLEPSKCGFFVHPDKGWLGASPDIPIICIGIYTLVRAQLCQSLMKVLGPKRPILSSC